MDMRNQYKEETSQIHAPTDLIQRTKQAVREEERRIEQMRVQQAERTAGERQAWGTVQQGMNPPAAESQGRRGADTGKTRKYSYGRVYRWALPVAAAVLLVVLLNVSSIMVGRKFSSSKSDAPMDMAAGMAGGAEETTDVAYDFAEAEAVEEAFDDMDGGINKAFADNGFMEESTAEAEESVAGAVESADAEGKDEMNSLYEESAADEAPAEADEYDNVDSGDSEAGLSEDSIDGLMIEEVKEKPEFCDNKNTQCIDSHGLQFYVAREWGNQWKAYVRVNETGYVITGSGQGIADREAFAGKAYELLVQTVDGIE